ncbi:MAG TPA: (4Fe-4S)-binding protein [Chitinophaga sp.]
MNIIKHYTNGEVTIVWKPDVCIHSARCFQGLPAVFDPREKPWIRPEAATTAHIVSQVEKCPSGALSYFYNEEQLP